MIRITDDISIDENDLHWDFIRSSGPGGQNVNKVSTAVQLRLDVIHSVILPDDVRERLYRLAGRRITAEGILIIDARQFRSQDRNRRDALERLISMIEDAAKKPKRRIKTKPSPASKMRRLEYKRYHSLRKNMRGKKPDAE